LKCVGEHEVKGTKEVFLARSTKEIYQQSVQQPRTMNIWQTFGFLFGELVISTGEQNTGTFLFYKQKMMEKNQGNTTRL